MKGLGLNRQRCLEGYVDTTEAAARIGIHWTSVHRLIRQGKLPVMRYGRAYLIKEEDVMAYITEATQ